MIPLADAGAVLRRVPWQVWAAAALLLAGWAFGHSRYTAGVAAERARWEALQAKADREAKAAERARDAASVAVSEAAVQAGHEAVVDTRTETVAAVERVRYVTRTISVPAECPEPVLPASVHAEGRQAVERARAAGRSLRAGADP